MRGIQRTLLAALFIATPVAGAVADYMDGNKLLDICNKGDGGELFCGGYVTAVADLTRFEVWGYRVCTGSDVTVKQIKDVVVLHLQKYPEKRHFEATSIVAQALSEAFPCKN